MEKCKECGKEISSKAKRCPHCGVDTRNWFMRHKILSVIGAFVILGVFGAMIGGGSDDSSVETSDNTAEQETVIEIGETVTTDEIEATILSVDIRDSVGSDMFNSTPAEGGKYVATTWQYKNISDSPMGSFSQPMISLVDSDGNSYKSDVDASSSYATEQDNDSKLMSELNPGITVKASKVFEISEESLEKDGWQILINADKKAYVNID